MEVVQLSIDKIVVENNLRTFVPDDSLAGLTDSVQEVGLLSPIVVRKQAGEFYLVSGHRRLTALQNLDCSFVPAVILPDDQSIRQVQLIENFQREDLNPIDRAQAVQLYIQSEGLSKSKAATKLGIPRTTINDWLEVLEVGEKYQTAILSNFYGGRSALTPSHIGLARRFAEKVNSPQMLEILLDGIIDYSLSRAETKEVIGMMSRARDTNLADAVHKVRRSPFKQITKVSGQWDMEQMMSYLSRSSDYLVKYRPHDVAELSEREKEDFLRHARALAKLLEQVGKEIEQTTKHDITG